MRSPSKIVVITASALLAGCPSVLLAGCSSAHPAGARHPAARGQSQSSAAGSARPRPETSQFTVTGSYPVEPNSSQDTHAQAAGAACRPRALRRDQSLGDTTATGFSFAGATTAAHLLTHFLGGAGTAVRFGPRSPIARQARASRPFRTLNRRVQAEVARQLRAGRTRVRVPGALLTPVLFAVPGSTRDLYLSFRGTQGLDVSGTGTISAHRYSGTLTYVIRDSYGFPPRDQLLGIGAAMRYLQVNCGRPPHGDGARWFPDSVTVSVPFTRSRAGVGA